MPLRQDLIESPLQGVSFAVALRVSPFQARSAAHLRDLRGAIGTIVGHYVHLIFVRRIIEGGTGAEDLDNVLFFIMRRDDDGKRANRILARGATARAADPRASKTT